MFRGDKLVEENLIRYMMAIASEFTEKSIVEDGDLYGQGYTDARKECGEIIINALKSHVAISAGVQHVQLDP